MNGWIFIIIGATLVAVGGIMATYGWHILPKPDDLKSPQISMMTKQETENKRAPVVKPSEINPEEKIPQDAKKKKKQTASSVKNSESNKPLNTQTAYSELNNDQLRKEVLVLVDKMRGYLERQNLQEQTRSLYYQQQMKQAKTEGEKQIVWDAETHALLTAPNMNYEYSEKFKADAVLLRDEIISRLPQDYKPDGKNRADYDHPTNPIGLNMVIDDLEKLAKTMPK